MGLGLSMRLEQSHRLTQRQELEHKLIQAMKIELVQRLEVAQYLERESSFKDLYAKALASANVYTYNQHGLDFEYALVSRDDLPMSLATDKSCGFAHVLYDPWDEFFHGIKIARARGSWLLFVVPDFFSPLIMPEEVIHYVAVHEHGEEVTLGEHYLATKLEFAISKLEKKISWYVSWLKKRYPVKFVDVFSHQTKIVLPDSDEFQRELELRSKSDYATHIRQSIENFDWPPSILQQLKRYEERGRTLQGLLLGAFTAVAMEVGHLSPALAIPDAISQMRASLKKRLHQSISQESVRWICLPNARQFHRTGRSELISAFDKYRVKRQKFLESRGQGMEFIHEVSQLGTGSFPNDTVLSADTEEVLRSI